MQSIVAPLFFFAVLLQAQPAPSLKQPKKQTHTKQQEKSESNPAKAPMPINSGADSKPCTTKGQSENKQAGKDSRYLDTFFTACIAIFTAALVVAVCFQIRDYRTRERAWVMVHIEQIPTTHALPAGTIYRFAAGVRNFGATPATILNIDCVGTTTRIGEQLPNQPHYLSEQSGEQTNYQLVPKGIVPVYSDVPEAEMQRVNGGEVILYLYGRINYRDIFRSLRETRFCYRYYPPIQGSIDPHVGYSPEGPPPYHEIT